MKTGKQIQISVLAIFVLLFLSCLHCWAVPGLINFQGKLTDNAGVPMDGTFKITFVIYDSTIGGNALWKERQNVTVTDGIYNVKLGALSPLPPGLFSGENRYLEVRILNPDTALEETLAPRERITSTAFAIKAGDANTFASHTIDELALMDDLSAHAADPSTHHSKTTSFTELTDQVADSQIPDTITRDSELAAHALNSSAHHVRYSDTEAVAAMGAKADTNPLNHDRFTESEAVSAILNNDGPGSGLDADLLDGQNAADIITAATDEVRTPISECGTVISSPGSYYLTGNLTCSGQGISVAANDVTIDLMGFTISGSGSTGYHGIKIAEHHTSVEIKNGTVREFDNGIWAESNFIRIINMRTVANNHYGIILQSGNLVSGCIAADNGRGGINCGSGSILKNNVAYNNGLRGISAGDGSVLINNSSHNNVELGFMFGHATFIGNVADSNTSHGILDTGCSTLLNNTSTRNGGDGINVGPGSTVNSNTSSQNDHWGIFIDRRFSTAARVRVTCNTINENNKADQPEWGGLYVDADCYVKGNHFAANKQNNIYVAFSGNIIEENLVNASVNGIFFNAAGNFWANNRASGNTTNYANTAGQTNGGGNYGF